MLLSFWDIITILVVYQCFFLCIWLWYRSKSKTVFFLIAFLLTVGLDYLSSLFYATKIVFDYPQLAFIFNAFPLLSSPLIYLYVKKRTFQFQKLSPLHFLHTVPFLCLSVWIYFNYYQYSIEEQRQILETGLETSKWQLVLIVWLGNIQILMYLILSFLSLRIYAKEIRGYYANLEHINLNWLRLLLLGYSALHLLNIFESFWGVSTLVQQIYALTGLTTLLYLSLILFRGYEAAALKLERTTTIIPSENSPNEKDNNDSEKLYQTIYEEAKKLLDQPHIYTDSNLSLHLLTENLSYSERQVSQAINQEGGMNFYDFVNQKRVEATKELLIDSKMKSKNITQIMYEVGFNSKSSFNTAFKKYTGKTPSAFRKENSK